MHEARESNLVELRAQTTPHTKTDIEIGLAPLAQPAWCRESIRTANSMTAIKTSTTIQSYQDNHPRLDMEEKDKVLTRLRKMHDPQTSRSALGVTISTHDDSRAHFEKEGFFVCLIEMKNVGEVVFYTLR